MVEKADVETDLLVDSRHILLLELKTVFLLLELEQVLVLEDSCVLEWCAEHFSLDKTSFQVKYLLDVLTLALLAVSHKDEVNWILVVHFD